MNIGIVSMRYAKALLAYAQHTGCETAFYDEMRMLDHSYRTFPKLRAAVENPALPRRERFSLISHAASGPGEVRRELGRFIDLVMKNGREEMLQYIALGYIDLYRQLKHIGVARLTTAVPITPLMQERITRQASAMLHASMEITTATDPDLEGGFVFDINDYRLDASVATQLKKVKQQFIDKNRRIV